eukprot:3789101-Rhodomonas_salina.1
MGSAYKDSQHTAKSMTLAQWQQKVSRPEEEHAAESRAMVRRSFTSPALKKDLNEQYRLKGVDGAVRGI